MSGQREKHKHSSPGDTTRFTMTIGTNRFILSMIQIRLSSRKKGVFYFQSLSLNEVRRSSDP